MAATIQSGYKAKYGGNCAALQASADTVVEEAFELFNKVSQVVADADTKWHRQY